MRTLLLLIVTLLALALGRLYAAPARLSAASDSGVLSSEQRFRLDSMAQEREAKFRELEHQLNAEHFSRQSISNPEDIIGIFIPIIAILGAFFVVWRSIESKRALRLAMIEKGMDPSLLETPTDESSKKFGALRFGMLLAGVGFGLMLAIFIVNFWATGHYEPAIFLGSAILCGGIGLVAYHIIARRLEK